MFVRNLLTNKGKKEKRDPFSGICRPTKPMVKTGKMTLEPNHCFPFPKELCHSESSQASTGQKYMFVPICPSGSRLKMNKEQGWDDSNSETPKRLAIDLSIFNLSTTNPT
jgi:hypothetical protein